MKHFVLAFVLLIYGIEMLHEVGTTIPSIEEVERTEEFIFRWLQNDNGTIATYILDSEGEDEDLVQGREALAETVGLLMLYALEKKDRFLFDSFYEQLNNLFIENDGFVNWKINEDGESEVSTNALIDDLRIMDALISAHETWGGIHYFETAQIVGDYLTTYSVNNGTYTDFYEKHYKYASENIKLSYIDIQVMDELVEKKLLDSNIVEMTSNILYRAPIKNGFYPLTYNVVKEKYIFDESVNILDQAILAYHLAQVGKRSEEFLIFIKQEMNERNAVHGLYSLETKEPVVKYESPAVYGFLISYALLLEEEELAEMIYDRLKRFKVNDHNSDYYGGYTITEGNTHIFDNIVPLLAELVILNN